MFDILVTVHMLQGNIFGFTRKEECADRDSIEVEMSLLVKKLADQSPMQTMILYKRAGVFGPMLHETIVIPAHLVHANPVSITVHDYGMKRAPRPHNPIIG